MLKETLRVSGICCAQKGGDGVTAKERRKAILRALDLRRHDTRENLAFEFGVSKRTIDNDIMLLSSEYPIYTLQGRGGGIYVAKWYSYGVKYLTEAEAALLERLAIELSPQDASLILSVLERFTVYERRKP